MEMQLACGWLAQLVEQLTLNQWAQGSSPWSSTKNNLHESLRFDLGYFFIDYLDWFNIAVKPTEYFLQGHFIYMG